MKIYIHDSAKDIFYELENLNEIKDRTILKLFETDGSGRGPSGDQSIPTSSERIEISLTDTFIET